MRREGLLRVTGPVRAISCYVAPADRSFVAENNSLANVANRHRAKLDNMRQWLLCTLQHGALPPRDRANAGDVLAELGDPRFLPRNWAICLMSPCWDP